jgi:hypothetical protein
LDAGWRIALGSVEIGVRVREEGDLVTGEEGFEEEGGGYLVDEVLAGDAVLLAGASAEEGVGFVGGEALIEEVEREGGVGGADEFDEGVGEGEGFEGLGAGGAVGVEGVADEEGVDVMLADEAGDGFEVGAEVGLGGGAVEGEEGLGGEAEGVGDGQADALVADVEREDAGWGHRGLLARIPFT